MSIDFHSSYSETGYNNDEFSDIVDLSNTHSMREKIKQDPEMKKLVYGRFKRENLRVLLPYSRYGINMKTLQKKLVGLWYDLWNFWPKKNGVDGDFWVNTFVWILWVQRALGMKTTWVANLEFLRYLYPHTFRTLNRKEGRGIKETQMYVQQRVDWYREQVEQAKAEIIAGTKKQLHDWQNSYIGSTSFDLSENQNDEINIHEPLHTQIDNFFKNEAKNGINGKQEETIGFNQFYFSEDAIQIGWMTYCSRTARENLHKLWIPAKDVPRGRSAIASMKMYREKNYVDSLNKLPKWTNVLDIFVDSRSRYEHRAAAYLMRWEWYVLDPYAKIYKNTTDPIPLSTYASKKKIMWVFPHTSKIA